MNIDTDKQLKSLIESAAMQALSKDAIFSTIRYVVPITAAFAGLPDANRVVTLSERTPVGSLAAAYHQVSSIAAQMNQGFFHLFRYLLHSATYVTEPVYGLDLEASDRSVIESIAIAIDRNRLQFPTLEKDGDGISYLNFAKPTEE